MKIVSAYRQIEPYMPMHRELAGKFDWIEALKMLHASARMNARLEVFAITDQKLSVPSYRYRTTEQLLMLWILEISALYLESKEFDQNTVFISPDSLVCGPLNAFSDFDIGLVARRGKFREAKSLMNGLQFWPIKARDKLVALYREALRIARTLEPKIQQWGADTMPLIQLLGPIVAGAYIRFGMRVKIFDPKALLLCSVQAGEMEGKGSIKPRCRVVDFKFNRKLWMVEYNRRYCRGTFGAFA